jgi:hypothetical protein
MSIERFLPALILSLVAGQSDAAGNSIFAEGKSPFLVFDGLLYKGKPDLASFGMTQIVGINPVGQTTDRVDDEHVRTRMQVLHDYDGVLYLDYESWPLFRMPEPTFAANIENLKAVVKIAHDVAPAAKIGYYDIVPCRDYWSLVKNDQATIKQWQDCNVRVEDLAQYVDVVMPSLYTFYNDPHGWDIYAAALLDAARRYHKPVYAFLWPEFHVSNSLLKGQNIPASFWRHELEFCRSRADGIVIWGGWQVEWDEQAPWWLETKAFLAGLNAR